MDWFAISDAARADDVTVIAKVADDNHRREQLWSLAAHRGSVRILQAMLDADMCGIRVRDLGQHDDTDALLIPLIDREHAIDTAVTIHGGYKPLVALLKGATPEDLADPALMHTAIDSCCEAVQKVVALYKAGVPLDTRDSNGRTPLMKAVKRGEGVVAAVLVALGASTEGAEELIDHSLEDLLPEEARRKLQTCGMWFAASGTYTSCPIDHS